jgi:two-component system cell cycle response regulator
MSKHLKLPTLLVIADNPSVRFWIKKNLNDQFFVIDATKKSAALEAIQYAPLDFIIIDSGFEDCDPIELCQEMRQLLHTTLTPILLITGRLKRSYREAALEAGVTDFLSDQLDLDELETRIATGQKAVSMRQKTVDISSALKKPKNESSENYLKNKLVLHDQALRLLADAKKEKVPMTLLLLQIDGFNDLQSRLGILTAEEILLPLSTLLNRHLRAQDLLIPSAEGRFIILLHTMPDEEAKHFAEVLRKEVQQQRFKTKNGELHLTVSIAFSSIAANETAFNKSVNAAIKSLAQTQSTTNLIISLKKENP